MKARDLMTTDVETVTPDEPIWRVGHAPTAWTFTPWQYAASDGKFHGRWDDPDGDYRVLYAADSRYGGFLEALTPFRPDLHLVAPLAMIAEDDPDDPATLPAGTLPKSWLDPRQVASATVTGHYVAVGQATTLGTLRRALAASARHHGLDDLDAATSGSRRHVGSPSGCRATCTNGAASTGWRTGRGSATTWFAGRCSNTR